MKKVVLAGFVAGIALAGSAVAQPYYGYGQGPGGYQSGAQTMPPRTGYGYPSQPPAMQQTDAASVLQKGMDDMLAFLRQSPPPGPMDVAVYLETKVAPAFDFTYMARAAAGPVYRDMDEGQKQRLEQKLKEMFLGTLAKRLASFEQQQVQYLPPRRGRGNRATIGVLVQNPAGYPAKLDFQMMRGEEGWKIVDVAANNTSALAFYRNYFKQAMSGRSGPPPRGGAYR